ncbi:MAG: uracil-DNA glycosylase [Candidatus Binataceae bacterium]
MPERRAALTALRKTMLACQRCAALTRSRSRVVPGVGAVNATVAFVGLAPGRFGGDRTGIPFNGDRSGNLLRAMIRTVGLHRVFITNLVRCNPRDGAGRNRDPCASEIANCRRYLYAELALVRPRLVVCLGRSAWRELAGAHVAFAPRQPAIVTPHSMALYPMYHPAYVVRGAYSAQAYARDFVELKRMLNALEHRLGVEQLSRSC